MQGGMTTLPPPKQRDIHEPRVQAVITEAERDKGEGENFGESTTGKPSDPTPNRTDSEGQSETGQDTIHADGTSDNPIQPKPD